MPGTAPFDELTPEILIRAYALGIFPMANGRDDPEIHWVDPRRRGILPLDGFHLSRSLGRSMRRGQFRITTDSAFDAVVTACAEHEETWISHRIQDLYSAMHLSGHGHSFEVWKDEALVGGLYGIALGSAFFGESMFSRATDASKIALAHAVHRLRTGGFTLFDTQFLTPHLASLGGQEISRTEYHRRLAEAIDRRAMFNPPDYSPLSSEVASSFATSGSTQDKTQTS